MLLVGAAKERGSAIDLGPAPRVKLGSISDRGIQSTSNEEAISAQIR